MIANINKLFHLLFLLYKWQSLKVWIR